MSDLSVKYSGPFADWTGYGEANRNAIMALDTVGVELTTERISFTKKQFDYGAAFKRASQLEGNPTPYDIKIIHVPSDGYLKYLEPTKYHIGHLFWETDSLSKTWVWNCNLMDEIWTGGEWHKENFRNAGVTVPIYVFPQAMDISPVMKKPFEIPEHEGFLFYSIFQWIERKNPKALLQAYWTEFEGVEDVSLLLKVYGKDMGGDSFQSIGDDIKKWKKEMDIEDFPRVLLFTKMISRDDIMRLHLTGDVFVSAHRGEGWGIPQVEAMSVGNPIISTNLGGVHEWLNDDVAHLIPYSMSNVKNMEFAPWYTTSQEWADVDVKKLRKAMRETYDNQAAAKKMGLQARKFVHKRFSYEMVGNLMKNRLEEIQKNL